ncbi:MAG TPA: SDR family oxidoreductase [Acidimicrobiales bacterium]|nr:SDR family oxidoreductase [Acidimicrobiales bacterium]
MEPNGKVVVVTGGASGIGRALCHAFADAGAQAVVVADIAGDGAEQVAVAIRDQGHQALAVRTDVGSEPDVKALVEQTEQAFGPVDVFCANAGIGVGGGVEVPDSEWQRIWQINVMSHIYAARAVLPSMLARGEGYLVHTASAAGLLSQLGSAPYTVTKHAVVALAEWLSITHGDAGIRVSCLCPQGVRTNMTAGVSGAGAAAALSPVSRNGMLEPEVVAADVLAAMAEERFLVLPHPEVATYEQRRASDRDRWLAGMRRAQSAMTAAMSGRGGRRG